MNNCLSDGHFSSHALRIKHNLGPTVYLFIVHFWQFRARFSGHQSNAIEVCLHCIYSHRQLNIPLENILCLGQGLLAQTTTRSPFHTSFPFSTARSHCSHFPPVVPIFHSSFSHPWPANTKAAWICSIIFSSEDVWASSSVVERALRMLEAPGSIPTLANPFLFVFDDFFYFRIFTI